MKKKHGPWDLKNYTYNHLQIVSTFRETCKRVLYAIQIGPTSNDTCKFEWDMERKEKTEFA
jgi:hypothetical protein